MAGETSVPGFDAEQIAFVTRRHEALNGLAHAIYGAAMVFAAVMLHFVHASTAYPLPSMTAFLFLQLASPSLLLENRYRVTFGRSEAPFQFATLASWTGLFVLLGALMDSIIMDRTQVRWPSAAGIGLAVSSGLVLLIDGRWRPHFAVSLCAGIAAIGITAGVPPTKYFPSWESDPVRAPVLLLANAFVGLGLVTAGVFDHRLLARTLTPFLDASGQTARARSRSAAERRWLAGGVCACALLTLCVPVPQMALLLPFSILYFGLLARPTAWLIRRIRRMPAKPPSEAEPFGLHPDTLIMLAVGAVLDTTFRWPAPIALMVVFALSSFWTALRDWPFRKYYLVGTVAPLLTLPLAIGLEPARAFTLLLFVCTAALSIESHLDGRGAPSPESSEPDDAVTI